MYRILYAEKADEDLTEIYSYIAADSPERVAAYLGKMESCILQLQDFPNIGYGGKYPELVKLGIRCCRLKIILCSIPSARRRCAFMSFACCTDR